MNKLTRKEIQEILQEFTQNNMGNQSKNLETIIDDALKIRHPEFEFEVSEQLKKSGQIFAKISRRKEIVYRMVKQYFEEKYMVEYNEKKIFENDRLTIEYWNFYNGVTDLKVEIKDLIIDEFSQRAWIHVIVDYIDLEFNKRVQTEMVRKFEFKEGKIIKVSFFVDYLGQLYQMGNLILSERNENQVNTYLSMLEDVGLIPKEHLSER